MVTRSQIFKYSGRTIAQQLGRMSTSYPSFRGSLTRNSIRWTGMLQPTPMSETYSVQIDYPFHRRPKVWVIWPKLFESETKEKIPHTFSDGSVCLHLHSDWTPRMFVAETIIPWLSLWLYHYEVWRATGTWHGGGHEQRANG
jgi:hypothetical protein